jgi:phosphoribosylanthranilate isomerase
MSDEPGRVRIKICGITNLADARCAAEGGADFLGFIFYQKSPRYVAPERAASIVHAIRNEWGATAPRFVGVFVDEPAAAVRAVLDQAGLDLAQLHGSEPPDEVQRLAPRAYKAIRPRSAAEAGEALVVYRLTLADHADLPQLLVDAYDSARYGGTGRQADWAVARLFAGQRRLLLAGGLSPETVGAAIEAVRPWGVDVSSGVERAPGLKDHERVRDFVRAVHSADRQGS